MAVLFVTEYGLGAGGTPVPRQPPIAKQVVVIGAGSLQSKPFNAATLLVRVHADTICSIAIDANPTAVLTDARMSADQTEWHQVTPGQQIAVIANT